MSFSRKLVNLAAKDKVFAGTTKNRPFKVVVIRTASKKTAMVRVKHRVPQRIYGNYLTHTTLYMCHDEHELCNKGDEVLIQKSRPFSKRKHWKVHSWVRREPGPIWFRIHPDQHFNDNDFYRENQLRGFDYRPVFGGVGLSPTESYIITQGKYGAYTFEKRKTDAERAMEVNQLLVSQSINSEISAVDMVTRAEFNLQNAIRRIRDIRYLQGLPQNFTEDEEPVIRYALEQLKVAKQLKEDQYSKQIGNLNERRDFLTAVKQSEGAPALSSIVETVASKIRRPKQPAPKPVYKSIMDLLKELKL